MSDPDKGCGEYKIKWVRRIGSAQKKDGMLF